MKKITKLIPLLILTISILCSIFSPVYVYADTLVVGSAATDRETIQSLVNKTVINKTNPLASNTTVTSVEVWAGSGSLTNFRVGLFYVVSGDTLMCRVSTADLGNISSGSKVTLSVSLAGQTGDYIGCYATSGGSGYLDKSSSGGSGFWTANGEYIDVNDSTSFINSNNSTDLSIGGYVSSTTPPTVSTSAATDASYTTATLNGEITDFGTATNAVVTFEYGLTTGYGSTATADESPMSGTGTFHADISSLDDNTTYHFRAKVDADDTDPVYGTDRTFTTLTQLPSVTTNSPDYTSPGAAIATLNGELTSIGDDTEVDVYFEWDYDGSPYTYSTTPDTISEIGTFDYELTGFYRNQTIYYRAVAENNYGAVYGDETSFLVAPNELTQVLWYQPNTIISETTLPDLAGTAQNGVITWGTNPANITITLGTIAGKLAKLSYVPPTSGSLFGEFNFPPQMFSELSTDAFPFGEVADELLEEGDTPAALWWFPFIFLLIAIIGLLVYDATQRNGGEGSLMAMIITIEVLLVIFGVLGSAGLEVSLIPLFPAFLFPIAGICFMLSRKASGPQM